jgi:hypothetical protein
MAMDASSPAMPRPVRASAPHRPHDDRRIEAPRILLTLENGALLSSLYQWCDLPPVDLFLRAVDADGSWRSGGQSLDCGALLQRALDQSTSRRVIIQPTQAGYR